MKRINLVIISIVSINPSINDFHRCCSSKYHRRSIEFFFSFNRHNKISEKYNFFSINKNRNYSVFCDAFHRKGMEFLKNISKTKRIILHIFRQESRKYS